MAMTLTNDDLQALQNLFATKADLADFATKDDLKVFATKDDLKVFATKDDLTRYATKDDLRQFATKDDLKTLLKRYATKDDLKQYATKNDLHSEIQSVIDLINDFMAMVDGRFQKLEQRTTKIERHLSRKRYFPQLKLGTQS